MTYRLPPPRRPLDVVRTATGRSLPGDTTLTVELRLDQDVDGLHVLRRLLELIEDLGDAHAGSRDRDAS